MREPRKGEVVEEETHEGTQLEPEAEPKQDELPIEVNAEGEVAGPPEDEEPVENEIEEDPSRQKRGQLWKNTSESGIASWPNTAHRILGRSAGRTWCRSRYPNSGKTAHMFRLTRCVTTRRKPGFPDVGQSADCRPRA